MRLAISSKSIGDMFLPYINILGAYFYCYVGIFAIFSLNILPQNLLMLGAVIIFLCTPLDSASYLYIFSLPWMYVAKFSFGITLSLIQSVLLIAKIVLSKKTIKMELMDCIYLLFLSLCGIMNMINYKSFTGISFVFYFIISTYFIQEYFREENERHQFWKLALYSVVFSCLLATIYGSINNTSIARWVHGMGYAKQLYGTMGTTRFGIYLCIGLLFAFYYIERKWIKIAILLLVSIGIISTISMTAIVLMLFVYIFYYLTSEKISVKKIVITILIVLLIGLLAISWNRVSNIELIKPVALRIEQIIEQAQIGDMSSATTGRSDLLKSYFMIFENSSMITKLFGSFELLFDNMKYSHNSYIDMLNYCGIIGVALTIILQAKRLYNYKENSDYKMYILLKMIIIFPATTVSIFSAQFWQIWLFI